MKQEVASSIWKRLENPKAVRAVMDPGTRRFLESFIGQERTVSEVASELGVHMSSVLYRVKQFLCLELLEVSRVEPRAGRPVKYYRTVANGFFAPFQATSLIGQEELSPHTFSKLQRALTESIGQAWLEAAGEQQMLGLHIFRHANGVLGRNIVPDLGHDSDRFFAALLEPAAPAVWDTWGNLRLSHDDAKALQNEIAALIGRYLPKEQAQGGQEYIVRLAMAPLKR